VMGSGYGQSAFAGGVTSLRLRDNDPGDPTPGTSGWIASANVNDEGTGGFNGAAEYTIDGPNGGYYYLGEFVAGGGAVYGDYNDVNNLWIASGGTGYWPGATNATQAGNMNTANAIHLQVTDAGTDSRGTFNYLGANPTVTGSTAATTGGMTSTLSAATNTGARNATLYIGNDNAGAPMEVDDYGNYRLYLGHTPGQANGANLSWAANEAGEIAWLDIVANSTVGTVGVAGSNATSGIGYTAGSFMVYDADGDAVTGLDISYETDSAGRVYTMAKGQYNGSTNVSTGGPDATAIAAGVNHPNGWMIVTNGNYDSVANYTLVPQGNGFGFNCRGLTLRGEVYALPAMATNGSFDTVGLPKLTATAMGTASVPNSNSSRGWTIGYSDVPTGHLSGGSVTAHGDNYSTAPVVTTATGDTGTLGELSATLGGVGRRYITGTDGVAVEVDLYNAGYACYPNGDFNGDNWSDLVFRSYIYGCALWNMGPNGQIISAGTLPDPGYDWTLAGIGKMGFDGVGCCLFWHNIYTGQTAVWVVNSSDANPDNWLLGGSYLDTVADLGYTPRRTNNAVQNSGSGVYWQQSASGGMAHWPVHVAADYTANNNGAAAITFNGTAIALPSVNGYNIGGVANMYGRPASDGYAAQRDMMVTSGNGDTAVWIMASDNTSIAMADYTTYQGSLTSQFYALAGIGQYAVNSRYATVLSGDAPGGGFRNTWFGNPYWVYPGSGSSFAWKIDRTLDLINYTVSPATGNGMLNDPYGVTGTASAN
jgi:hypothetical protein